MTGEGTVPDPGDGCPGVSQVVAFLDGELTPRERVLTEAHLAGCEDCRQLVSALAPAPTATLAPASGLALAPASGLAPAPASGLAGATEPGAPALAAAVATGFEGLAPGPGQIVAGKYRIERVLGQGGMGLVLEAHDLTLRRRVAIKLLLPGGRVDRLASARFLREARVAARLTGEHVARVLDYGVLPGGPFVVIEHLEGLDLAELLARRGALPLGEAVDLLCQAGAGLAEVHAAGFVHRDVKPGNFFVVQRPDRAPRVKLLDFGIAKADGVDSRQQALTAGAFIGSPLYASPEQLQESSTVDARSDVWSFGCVAYELLTGRPPFAGDTLTALLVAIVTTEPTPPRGLVPALPAAVEAVVLRCLRKDRSGRPASIGEVLRELAAYGASGESTFLAQRVSGSLPPPAAVEAAPVVAAVAAMEPTGGPSAGRSRLALGAGLVGVMLLAVAWAWRAGVASVEPAGATLAGTTAGAAVGVSPSALAAGAAAPAASASAGMAASASATVVTAAVAAPPSTSSPSQPSPSPRGRPGPISADRAPGAPGAPGAPAVAATAPVAAPTAVPGDGLNDRR